MILFTDSEGPDQTVRMHPHMPEDIFSHDAAYLV